MTNPALRYAKGLYIAAEDQKVVKPVFDLAMALQEALSTSKEALLMLSNPLMKDSQKIQMLQDVLSALKADKKAVSILENLLEALAEQRRLAFVDAVFTAFKQIVDEKEGRLSVEVVTASPLSGAQRKEIEAFVKKECSDAKVVEISEKLNKDLIAGVKIRMGSVEVDASARGRLDRMKNSLGL